MRNDPTSPTVISVRREKMSGKWFIAACRRFTGEYGNFLYQDDR